MGSDPPRAILVGAGGMGQTWAKLLRDTGLAEHAAWVDLDLARLEQAQIELGVRPVHVGDDLAKAIAVSGADFVIDVTVPEAHCEVTLASLKAGLPVLGEKPMAASMEQARKMVRASEESGKLYMVSQSRRYDSRLAAYRGLIEELGPLGILNADFFIGPHFGGFRDEMPSPLVLDMAIHTFDQARFLSGANPVSVYCEEFNPGWSWYKGDVSATALFHMSDGLRFTYRGSWCSEGLPTSWESEWRAVGPKGTALWDGHRSIRAETVKSAGGFFSEVEPASAAPGEGPHGIEGALREFLDAVQTGRTPMGECHDNIMSLAMVFGAIESSREGKRVAIEPLIG
ncbi:MAG: Gfo/Idh/MocA family oxidoreductase [Armatimonadetes bacterium]|nr:Gfo/Idh/MocA family oxidoreductase [Armatimonadota bacterium]